MTMVLKYGVEEMSLSQTDIQLQQINEPCAWRSYTSPNYVRLRQVSQYFLVKLPIRPIDWIAIGLH